jgi:23S rRNA (guanosine2251-2'-O)-methyltransferase
MATPERARQIEARFGRPAALEIADNALIAQNLPQGAAHQGVALRAAPLAQVGLDAFEPRPGALLLMLDQVTDPQNVGAILRSAAAFGAAGLVLQDRHAPHVTGALAKAAAGAVERVPLARVVNLSRALDELMAAGWRSVGLAGQADQPLAQVLDGRPTVLVLGSEGEGLRRLVSEHCDVLAKIPMPGGFESLNVGAAAAVALYEAARPR